MPTSRTSGLPLNFFDSPLISSGMEQGSDGNLYRIEVRGDAHHKVRGRFPMPADLGGPSRTPRPQPYLR